MRNQKGLAAIWVILIIVIALALGAIVGYYYFKSKNDKTTTPTLTSTPTPSSTTLATTPSDTADWKTYKIHDLGISFKYPKEWGEVSLETGAVSADAGSGKSGRITFSDPSTRIKDDYQRCDICAGYVSPDFSVGREPSDYEEGSTSGAYKTKNCEELKKVSAFYEDITNCKFITAKNGRQAVTYNNLYFVSNYITAGYYFTGRDEFPLFGIEYISGKENSSYLNTFQKVIESIE